MMICWVVLLVVSFMAQTIKNERVLAEREQMLDWTVWNTVAVVTGITAWVLAIIVFGFWPALGIHLLIGVAATVLSIIRLVTYNN